MAVCCASPANIGTLGGGTGPLTVLRLPDAIRATTGTTPIAKRKAIFRTDTLNHPMRKQLPSVRTQFQLAARWRRHALLPFGRPRLFFLPGSDGSSIVPGCFFGGICSPCKPLALEQRRWRSPF